MTSVETATRKVDRRLQRWDWAHRLIAVALVLLAIVAMLGILVAIRTLDSADQRGTRASERITSLQKRITQLQDEVTVNASSASADRARLQVAIDGLSDQVRRLGGTPITSSAPSPVPSPSTATTTPTTTPAGNTPPGQQPKCSVKVLGVCL